MIQIKHPKALMVAVLATAFAGAAVVAVADNTRQDPDGLVATNIPIDPAATVSPVESAAVEAMVRSSAGIENLNENQEFLVSEAAFAKVAGHERAFAVRVSWERPVEIRTRWLLLRCQGTRRYEPEVTWQNVAQIRVTVDLATQEIVGFGVSAPLERESGEAPTMARRLDEPAPGESFLRDLTTGDLIASGSHASVASKAQQCPPGSDDD